MHKSINEPTDSNGRFTDPRAYTASTIGNSIIEIFSNMTMPRDAGLDVIRVLLGNEPSEHCNNPNVLETITKLGAEIKAMFIEGKATEDEFKAGLDHVLAECEQFADVDAVDKAIAEIEGQIKDLQGGRDAVIKTIH